MQHSVKLKNISTLKTGYTFRGKIEAADDKADLSVIQPKDVENGNLLSDPVKIDKNRVSVLSKHLLNRNDLLLANKGIRFSTFIYKNEPFNSIASSSFFVIKPDPDIVISEYLQWYLSAPQTLDYLKKSVSGSTVPTLTLATVADLDIPLPSISIQRKIADMATLIKKEEEVWKSLMKKRKDFMSTYSWELIQSKE